MRLLQEKGFGVLLITLGNVPAASAAGFFFCLLPRRMTGGPLLKKYKKPGLWRLRVADIPNCYMVENNKGIQKKRMLDGMDTMSKKTK